MSVNSVNSNSGNTGFAAAGAAAGAGAGVYAASKAVPAIIQFAQNTANVDTFTSSCAKKAADFATKHKTGAVAIGAAVVAGVGALIGTAAANKSNESVSSFNG